MARRTVSQAVSRLAVKSNGVRSVISGPPNSHDEFVGATDKLGFCLIEINRISDITRKFILSISITPKQLRALDAMATHGHFIRVAKALGVT